jgi:hypothetical protein
MVDFNSSSAFVKASRACAVGQQVPGAPETAATEAAVNAPSLLTQLMASADESHAASVTAQQGSAAESMRTASSGDRFVVHSAGLDQDNPIVRNGVVNSASHSATGHYRSQSLPIPFVRSESPVSSRDFFEQLRDDFRAELRGAIQSSRLG